MANINQTLEQRTRTKNKCGPCRLCGNDYNKIKRQEEISYLPKPNSAIDYCSNKHWVIGTSIEETS